MNVDGKGRVSLALTALLSFIAMYALMYAMVAHMDGGASSFDRLYMTGVMTIPMVLIEMALMWSMYMGRTRIAVLIVLAVVALVGMLMVMPHHIPAI